MPREVRLGDELLHKEKKWRIVRIIQHSQSLIDDGTGKCVVVDEGYLQLKDATGQIDFVELYRQEFDYPNLVQSQIKGLDPVHWKGEGGDDQSVGQQNSGEGSGAGGRSDGEGEEGGAGSGGLGSQQAEANNG